jgi:hypothetical protein
VLRLSSCGTLLKRLHSCTERCESVLFFLRIIFCKFANVEKSSINTQKIFCIKGFMFEDRITEEKTGREFKIHGWFLGKPAIGYFNLSLNTQTEHILSINIFRFHLCKREEIKKMPFKRA